MSYAITVVGTPEGIKKRLRETSEHLTDQSKREFDDVLPALEIIVDQNSNVSERVVLHLDASGHAYFKDGVKQYGNCNVHVRPIGVLVLAE
jgi:hypothetical protein